jgi:regulator of extracellular matrix RemA (YlzA/DUF370 family)
LKGGKIMDFSMILVGFDNYVPVSRITGVFAFTSSRLKQEVANRRKKPEIYTAPLFDCTKGRTIKSVITLDDGSYILSSVSPSTLIKRFNSSTT